MLEKTIETGKEIVEETVKGYKEKAKNLAKDKIEDIEEKTIDMIKNTAIPCLKQKFGSNI